MSRPLFLSIVITVLLLHLSLGTNADLHEINIFVQAVLAMADREVLGLPEKPVVQQYAPVVNGKLPPDLQRYLERLVSVSQAVEKQTLVAMLWDDTVVINEDQDPHDVFNQYRSRGSAIKQRTIESPPTLQTTDRLLQNQELSFGGNQAKPKRVETLYDGFFQYKRAKR